MRRHGKDPNPVRESRTGLARVLSKQGYCSRSNAWEIIKAGHVQVNGTTRRDPEWPVALARDKIQVDGRNLATAERIYLMLNKPRGLVTTASDEEGRATVFNCFAGHSLPFLSPVGRLDRASEGLLLFTNDTAWAEGITGPENHLAKVYHVQVNRVADDALLSKIRAGISAGGDFLQVKQAVLLRQGSRNSWLQIVLDEGKNRHIRRLFEALEVEVLRLVRIAIGALRLDDLPKGQFRALTSREVGLLRSKTTRAE